MSVDPELPPPVPLPAGGRADGPLPPHQHNCFGCGPDNAAGLHLHYARERETVHATLTLDARHEGAPGLAHGGALAAILDDVQGGVLVAMRQRAVTAKLEVNYVAPVVLGRELRVEAWLAGVEGRKIRLVGRVRDGERTVASGLGLFIAVDREHFVRAGATAGTDPQVGT